MKEFLNQALENERFLESLDKEEPFFDDFFDWKITLSLYCCPHYLKAFAAHKFPKEVIKSHDHMLKFLKAKAKPHIHLQYQDLHAHCMNVRYDGFDDLEVYKVQNKMDYHEIAKPCIVNIKKYVLNAMQF